MTLYKDASWQSKIQYSINLNDGDRKDTRHSISGTSVQDESTWIAFNLPVGTVVTLMDNWVTPPDGNVYNLVNCGRVVDLVGTGRTEGVDLPQCNMNDCISAWFWHTPDLSIGALELYEAANFKGNRTVLFLSEWSTSTDKVHSLDGWYIKDKASSGQWWSLEDAQMVSLFNGYDGSGSNYQNIQAWNKDKQLTDFKAVGFNDVVSSFRWNNLIPKKEVIDPVTVEVPNSDGTIPSTPMDWPNRTSAGQTFTIGLTNTTSQTTTVTVTNQYTAGMLLSYSLANKAGVGDDEITKEWTFGLGFQYTRSETTEMSKTQTTELKLEYQVNVPPLHQRPRADSGAVGSASPGHDLRDHGHALVRRRAQRKYEGFFERLVEAGGESHLPNGWNPGCSFGCAH